jgi:general stress protein 26
MNKDDRSIRPPLRGAFPIDNRQLEKQIVQALANNSYCTLATVEGDRPKMRYLVLFHEGFQIYMATSRATHKMEELEHNPHVALLFGDDGHMLSEIVDIQATAKVSKDESLRGKVWNDDLQRWFNSPQDPDYVILEITPNRIEYTDKDMNMHVWVA